MENDNELSPSVPVETVEKTDAEMLREIHTFMGEIKAMVSEVSPILEKLGGSTMGKMLGLR